MDERTATTLYRRWLDELWNGEDDRLDEVAATLVTADFVGHWPKHPDWPEVRHNWPTSSDRAGDWSTTACSNSCSAPCPTTPWSPPAGVAGAATRAIR